MSWFYGTTHKLHVYFERVRNLNLSGNMNVVERNEMIEEPINGFKKEIESRREVIREELERLNSINKFSGEASNKLKELDGYLEEMKSPLSELWTPQSKRGYQYYFVKILAQLHKVSGVAHELHNLFSTFDTDHKLLKYEEAKIEA